MSTPSTKTLRRVAVLATARLVRSHKNVQDLKRTQHADPPILLLRAVQSRISCEIEYDQAMLNYTISKG